MVENISCGDYAWPNVSHDFVLSLIAELGFQSVDVGLFGGYSILQPDEVRADPAASADALLRATSARGLAVTDVFGIPDMGLVEMSVNSPDPEQRKASAAFFRDLLEFVVLLGGSHMTLLPGTHHDGETLEQGLFRSATELTWRVEEAAARGVQLAIEPHTGSHLENPQNALLLLREVPGLTLKLDFGHYVYAGVGQEDVEPLIPFASILDCRGGQPGKVQTGLKDNEIDFQRIVALLQTAGFTGHYCVEYVYDDRPGCRDCDNLQEALAFRHALQAWTGS